MDIRPVTEENKEMGVTHLLTHPDISCSSLSELINNDKVDLFKRSSLMTHLDANIFQAFPTMLSRGLRRA